VEKIIIVLVIISFGIFGLSFIFSAEWWRRYELGILRVHEEMLGRSPLIGWWIKLSILWTESSLGLWFFRIIGSFWLLIAFSYTILLTV